MSTIPEAEYEEKRMARKHFARIAHNEEHFLELVEKENLFDDVQDAENFYENYLDYEKGEDIKVGGN